MGYTAKAVANHFLDFGLTRRTKISPLKIQKLVYISHGWHLALSDGEPLVADEYAEAWPYGPVFPSVYHEFKHYGSSAIRDYATDFELKGTKFKLVRPRVETDDANVIALLGRVWKVYGDFSSLQLSGMTHAPGTPWDIIWNKNKGMRNVHIPNDLIRRHYLKLMES